MLIVICTCTLLPSANIFTLIIILILCLYVTLSDDDSPLPDDTLLTLVMPSTSTPTQQAFYIRPITVWYHLNIGFQYRSNLKPGQCFYSNVIGTSPWHPGATLLLRPLLIPLDVGISEAPLYTFWWQQNHSQIIANRYTSTDNLCWILTIHFNILGKEIHFYNNKCAF